MRRVCVTRHATVRSRAIDADRQWSSMIADRTKSAQIARRRRQLRRKSRIGHLMKCIDLCARASAHAQMRSNIPSWWATTSAPFTDRHWTGVPYSRCYWYDKCEADETVSRALLEHRNNQVEYETKRNEISIHLDARESLERTYLEPRGGDFRIT